MVWLSAQLVTLESATHCASGDACHCGDTVGYAGTLASVAHLGMPAWPRTLA